MIADNRSAGRFQHGQGQSSSRLTCGVPEGSLPSHANFPGHVQPPTQDSALTALTEHYRQAVPKPLKRKDFPNPPRKGSSVLPTTIANVWHLANAYGFSCRFNVTKKRTEILVPGVEGSPENIDNVALTHICSFASLNGMHIGQVPAIVEAIADRNSYSPVADWILSKPWDGVNRLPQFFDTLTERRGFPVHLKQTLMAYWMMSAVAAILTHRDFRCRGVLTLQGPQGIGKTQWVYSLVSDRALAADVIKLDHHLDAHKDSLLGAIDHWIAELGELEGSLRRDQARVKGMLTASQDKVRRPYARLESTYPRRTVFCATVNDAKFLMDQTGNSRWWTVPVTAVNFKHGIDTQQLFAQIAVAFYQGAQWWLNDEDERLLEMQNKAHRAVSATRELVLDRVNLNPRGAFATDLTASALLNEIGIDRPTDREAKECAAVLREHLGQPQRIAGRDTWRVSLKDTGALLVRHAA